MSRDQSSASAGQARTRIVINLANDEGNVAMGQSFNFKTPDNAASGDSAPEHIKDKAEAAEQVQRIVGLIDLTTRPPTYHQFIITGKCFCD